MIPSKAISGMGLVRDGVAGRFRGEEVGQKIWAKKGTSLQPAGCQPPLHPSINGGASVAGQSGTNPQ